MAGGHGGRYVVTFAPLDGVENWHAETSIPQVVEELPDIVVGGQAADYPLSARLTFEEVQQAATWFSQYGGMCPSLTWVQD